jgi:hypothetical protein
MILDSRKQYQKLSSNGLDLAETQAKLDPNKISGVSTNFEATVGCDTQ